MREFYKTPEEAHESWLRASKPDSPFSRDVLEDGTILLHVPVDYKTSVVRVINEEWIQDDN